MVHTRCPSCSAALRPDAQWCGLCFRDLRPAPAPAPVASPAVPVPSAPAHSTPAQSVPARSTPARPVVAVPGLPGEPVATQLSFAGLDTDLEDRSASAAEPDPARQGGWPCGICSILVPIDAEACPSCGTSFLATLQAETTAQAPRPGVIMRLPRAARLAAAMVLSLLVAVVIPLLLTLLG